MGKKNMAKDLTCDELCFMEKKAGKEPPEKCPCCSHPKEYYEPECMCFQDDCKICN
jgi:rubrerythrin